jgi:hypothetical protein
MLQVKNLGRQCTLNALATLQHSSICLKHVPQFNQSSFSSNGSIFGSNILSKNNHAHLSDPGCEHELWYEPMHLNTSKEYFPTLWADLEHTNSGNQALNAEYQPQQPNSFNSSSYPCLFGNSHFWRQILLLVRKIKALKCVTSILLLIIDIVPLFVVILVTVINKQWNKQIIISPY